MSTDKSTKYINALNIARYTDIGLPPSSNPGLMNRTELYALLRRAGWRWLSGVQEWILAEPVQAVHKELEPVQGGQIARTDPSVFLVRIMAHREAMLKLRASLVELLEVFDYEVLSVSEPKANYGEEDWQRIYIRARMP